MLVRVCARGRLQGPTVAHTGVIRGDRLTPPQRRALPQVSPAPPRRSHQLGRPLAPAPEEFTTLVRTTMVVVVVVVVATSSSSSTTNGR